MKVEQIPTEGFSWYEHNTQEEISRSFLQTPQLKTLNELGSHALNTPVLRVNKASSPGLVDVNCLTKAHFYTHIQLKGKVTSTSKLKALAKSYSLQRKQFKIQRGI